MPPVCIEHGIYHKQGTYCSKCGVREWNEANKRNKATNAIAKTYNKKIDSIERANEKKKENQKLVKELLAKHPEAKIIKGQKTRAELKNELQSLVSKHFKRFCKDNGYYYCWITKENENKNAKGFFKLHTYHYFAKSTYWPLWDRKANLGLSNFDQNINKQYNVAAIRPMLIKVHGIKEVEKLEKDQQEIDLKIKQGLIKKYVPTDFLLAKIAELKRPDYILK